MTEPTRIGPADGESDEIEMLAAALRRDAADLALLTRVLPGALAELLPADVLTIERRRTMADRMAGREGRIERIVVSTENRRLILAVVHGRAAAALESVVHGVVLSRRPLNLDEWARELATALAAHARSQAMALAAMEHLLLGGHLGEDGSR
jgi:hypothetical protein